MGDRPFNEDEAARRLGISKASLSRERLAGRIYPIRMGSRIIRYTDAILDEYRRRCPDTVEAILAKALERREPVIREPGIYLLYRKDRVVYVGQTCNFIARLAAHLFQKDFDAYAFLAAPVEQIGTLEARLIEQLAPELNIELTGRPTARRTGYGR